MSWNGSQGNNLFIPATTEEAVERPNVEQDCQREVAEICGKACSVADVDWRRARDTKRMMIIMNLSWVTTGSEERTFFACLANGKVTHSSPSHPPSTQMIFSHHPNCSPGRLVIDIAVCAAQLPPAPPNAAQKQENESLDRNVVARALPAWR